MANVLPKIQISLGNLKYLTEQLKEKANVNLEYYNVPVLKRRVEHFYQKFEYWGFYKFVDKLIGSKNLLEHFVSEVIVPTTELFRDPFFWDILANHILPELRKNNYRFKIWLPEITTDDELFSLLILLHRFDYIDFAEIVATSPFEVVLNKFRNTILIPEKNIKIARDNIKESKLPVNLDDYFVKSESQYILKSSLLKKVKFQKFDFSIDEMNDTFDLVLFRNRLLYFKLEMSKLAAEKTFESLRKGGFWIIGIKESAKNLLTEIKLNKVEIDNIYKKS